MNQTSPDGLMSNPLTIPLLATIAISAAAFAFSYIWAKRKAENLARLGIVPQPKQWPELEAFTLMGQDDMAVGYEETAPMSRQGILFMATGGFSSPLRPFSPKPLTFAYFVTLGVAFACLMASFYIVLMKL